MGRFCVPLRITSLCHEKTLWYPMILGLTIETRFRCLATSITFKCAKAISKYKKLQACSRATLALFLLFDLGNFISTTD